MKMNTRWWQRKLVWNVRLRELGVFLLVYFIFGSLYSVALYLTSSDIYLPRTVIDYVLKFVCTIPIWWLLFVRLRQWPDAYRIALHIVLCPLFIICWLSVYHYIIDTFRIGRLDGKGMWWDVYIPFMFYVVQFGILHGYDLWKKTRMQQERENELLHLAHQSEMSALKAQLQPHFLFNTLNSINAGLTSANEDVRERIARLADTVRYSLRASQQETVPLYEELQFVKDYLWLEQERFKDRLHIIYHIDEDLANMEVPPMLLQPLVENAVKHGIAPSIEGGTITITVHRHNQKIGFEIADTGAGMNGTTPDIAFTKGIGLKNTRHRLAYLYDEAIHIESNDPIGTKVYFSIPDISNHP